MTLNRYQFNIVCRYCTTANLRGQGTWSEDYYRCDLCKHTLVNSAHEYTLGRKRHDSIIEEEW